MSGTPEDLQYEAHYWKQVACYLAGCQAATAEGALSRKSTSKYERGRMISICSRAAKLLRCLELPPRAGMLPHDPGVVAERCERIAKEAP